MFKRLLVANRGEVAVRIARACRELDVSPVGVVSEADLGASWTDQFDEVVCLGPANAAQSYLAMERIVQAALQTRCSALHPGWGFLAENTRFAALCAQHGIAFVGPRPALMQRLGSKSPAKRAMREAGLSPIPGSDGPLPDLEAALECAGTIGYPVLLKADSGGGGRGMRRCENEAQLREAFSSARAEAEAAFGDGSIYLERYLTGGRHIEVQILCDTFGNGIHCGERECSVQRKHQKLIEESPSPALSAEERAALGESALRAALRVGYTGAGTIEFLRTTEGELHFMEMNTRLQVEHPVSEMVTGLDIVALQIRIAANEPLATTQKELTLRGHAIEARINAEDPSRQFQPSPGRLDVFDIPRKAGPGTVRVETHLQQGDSVSPHYDSLIAKVIAHGEDRAQAIETLTQTLSSARIEGVATTIPLHLSVLASEPFRSGRYDTASIPGWPPAKAAARSKA